MATLSEALNTEREILNVYRTFLPRLRALIDQVKAIDPSAPNASQRLDALDAQYLAFNREISAALDPLDALARSQFDTLSEADKIAVNQSQVRRDTVQSSIQYSELREEFLAQSDIKLNQIERASQPPPATPTIDNTAAPANAAPTGTNTLQGTASDDSGAQPTTPASTATATANGETSVPGTSSGPSVNAPQPPGAERQNESTPNASTQGTPPYPNEEFDRRPESANSRPGKRLKNPLSFMSSYNYQLSLYIITPDAYDAFKATGRRNINVFNENIGTSTAAQRAGRRGGAFLLAQSGGVGTDPRAPNVKYDYYIDNLSFTHFVSPKSTGAPTGSIGFKFSITEPYGFSFINNLKQAQKEFDSYAAGANWGTAAQQVTRVPIARQFFILGIRFYGWDEKGVPVTGREDFNGTTLDPNAAGDGALFETFYELMVHKIKYKIDGKATVYDIDGEVTSTALGSNIKKGYINSQKEVYGRTVRDSISGPNGLLTKLNKEQQDLKNNNSIEFPVTYKIKWLGADAEKIALATLTSPARQQRGNQPAGTATNTEEVNDETATRSAPNNNQEKITIGSKPIIQALDELFSRSSYVEQALAFNYTDANEFDTDTRSAPTEATSRRPFQWYKITPSISNPEWDTTLRDWAYDITYIVETYKIPIIDNPFVVNSERYYGPHKRYDYWYTGENSEVISYTQELNNQYINEVPAGNPAANNTAGNEGNANRTAISVNTTRSIDIGGAGGGLATAAAGSIKNFLYDPGSYTNAKIQILGDPDFLMQETGDEIKSLNTAVDNAFDRFYNSESRNPFSIRPTGGQVFIEIDFKEAVDYSASPVTDLLEDGRGITGVGGTLSINDSILFWDYPPGTRDVVKGISYELLSVVSSFRNGLFTQTLDAVINDFGTGARATEEQREGGTPISGEIRQAVVEGENIADQAQAATGTTTDAEAGTGRTATPNPPAAAPEPGGGG